jgi:D-inositol-3-phosphate glycosyltransferase
VHLRGVRALASLPVLIAAFGYRWRRGRGAVIGRLLLLNNFPRVEPTRAEKQRVADDRHERLSYPVPVRQQRPLPAVTDLHRVDGARVLHVVGSSLPYVQAGSTLRTHAIVKTQSTMGLRASAVTAIGFPVMQGHLAPRADEWQGVSYQHLLPLLRPTRADRDYAHLLERHARSSGAQILHATTDYPNGRAAIYAAKALDAAFVYEVRGFIEDSVASHRGGIVQQSSEDYRLARTRENEVMRGADAIVTLSEGMRDELIGRGIESARITIVPNGVDDRFLEPMVDQRSMRERLLLDHHDVLIGVISTFHSYEGIPFLISVCERARRSGVDVGLVLVGDGAGMPAVRAAAGEHRWIRMTGRIEFSTIRDWFDAIDVLAVPREDHRVTRLVTPLKPVEALARGRAVLASDLPALREVTGGHALYVAAGDHEAWVNAIEGLSVKHYRCELGELGRAWVDAERRWSRLCDRYLSVYAAALSGP